MGLLCCLVSSIGACAPEAEHAGDAAEVDEAFSFSSVRARAVVPELTWSWWEAPVEGGDRAEPFTPVLGVELSAPAGLFKRATSTGPYIGVGTTLYGASRARLVIGADMRLYLQFDVSVEPELYCCQFDPNGSQDVRGTYGDVGTKGFYPVGRVEGVTADDLRHGVDLTGRVRLDEGLEVSTKRRIQRGDRILSIEAPTAPEAAAEAPELMTDRETVLERFPNAWLAP